MVAVTVEEETSHIVAADNASAPTRKAHTHATESPSERRARDARHSPAAHRPVAGRLRPAAGPKTYTIGVVSYNPILVPVLDGFKTKMTALGYVEGRNVTYLHQGLLQPDPQVIKREVERLTHQRIDLLLTLGTEPTLAARKVTAGTTIPVLFAPTLDPVG